ncbi:alkaline phosphatase D family protein [Botrimarina hoheduenensis]|uniref:alkaline phosphatase D family protein n=1 Tax=Botrimarina hoheduenensis TaxID=2528000 RepID=UPI001E6494EA|nr:alkaline phosphatase D family protein [Botrimarina hoheduenensis]
MPTSLRLTTRAGAVLVIASIGAWTLVANAYAADEHRSAASSVVLANGFKIGEAREDTAIVWTRTTNDRAEGLPGEVRIVWWHEQEEANLQETAWLATDREHDYTIQHRLTSLRAGSSYGLRVLSRPIPVAGAASPQESCQIEGMFRTPPPTDVPAGATMVVSTCQDYPRRDDPLRGHLIYESMLSAGRNGGKPDFFVHAGDILYYDRPSPFAHNVATARFKWNRMYALPLQRSFHEQVTSYFMKDDHDLLKDDCWPGQTYQDLTWDEGLAVYREQVPAATPPYRTVRWGADLEVWLLEGREFRSPNTMPDGPQKTILGAEQLTWLEKTTAASNATFKIVLSATPIIGPDRLDKNDNHANAGFSHEGKHLRTLLAARKNLFIVCGDRHWQYTSIDPATGLREYACGPASDSHAGGFSADQRDPDKHRFLRIAGGFLSVSVDRPNNDPLLRFTHHAVDGTPVSTEKWGFRP